MSRIMLEQMKKMLFGDKDPVSEPVWWLQICPVCGKTLLTPPNGMPIHIGKGHVAPYVIDSKNVTWKEARELVNVDDVLGLGMIISDPHEPVLSDKMRGFIKFIDAMAGVKMKGKDKLMERWK